LRLAEVTERFSVPEDVDAQIGWRRVRAKVLAGRGEVAEAELLAREATALAARTDYLDGHAQATVDLAEVLRVAGRSEEATALALEAIRLYDQKGNVVAAGTLRAQLAEPAIEV
jgi:hypothetical protein